MRTIAAVITSLTLALTSSPAFADVCLDLGGALYVGVGFAVPYQGNCRAWNGFADICAGDVGYSSGTICTSSGGQYVNVSITTTCRTAWAGDDDVVFTDAARMPRKIGSIEPGGNRFSVLDTGAGVGANAVFNAAMVDCKEATGSGDVWVP